MNIIKKIKYFFDKIEILQDNLNFMTLQPNYLNTLGDNNPAFLNYIIKFNDKLDHIYLPDKILTEYTLQFKNEIEHLINKGNCCIYSMENDVTKLIEIEKTPIKDYDLNSKKPIKDQYIQSNLNYLTYDQVIEKKNKFNSYIIQIGKGLLYSVTKNNIYISLPKLIDNNNQTYFQRLDWTLPYIQNFQELSIEEKEKIINNYYIKQAKIEYQKIKLNNQIEQIKIIILQHYQADIEYQLANIQQKIYYHQSQIKQLNDNYFDLTNHRIGILTTNYDNIVDTYINWLTHNELIKSIETNFRHQSDIKDLIITVYTKPLNIQIWNEQQAEKALPNFIFSTSTQKQAYIKALVNKELHMGIGPYKIKILCKKYTLEFTLEPWNVQIYSNRHWDRHRCLGSYTNAITEAQKNYNIFALSQLLLQYLQTINIGDIAGEDTIKNFSYIYDNEETIIYSKINNHIGKKLSEVFE